MNSIRWLLVAGCGWSSVALASTARAQGAPSDASSTAQVPSVAPPAAAPPPTAGNYPPPPGTYPPGAYPPGTYPPGTYPPGTYPPPPGAYPPGTYPPPPGAYPPGTYPPPPGAYPPGTYPPPTGAYPPPPGTYPPPPTSNGVPADPESTADEPEVTYQLHRFAFGAGLGLGASGSGLDRAECGGSACGTATVGAREYSHQMGVLLQGEAFYQALGFMRFGPVVAYSPSTKIEYKGVEGNTSANLGSVLSLDVAVEFTPRLGTAWWLLPRLQSGLSVVFPSKELPSRLEAFKTACNSGAYSNCDSLDGSRYGFNIGAGVGALWALSEPLRLRFDGLVEYYMFKFVNLEAGTANVTYKESSSGLRLVAHVGLEF